MTSSAFSEYLFLIQFGPAVLESVAVLAVKLDDPTMEIVYASPLLEEMFGWGHGELHGLSLDVLLRPEDVGLHHEHFARYQQQPTTRTMNAGVWVDGRRKDGSAFKAQVSLCVQPVGRQDCVIACIADVTAAFNHYKLAEFVHGEVRT